MKLYIIRHAESANNRMAAGMDYTTYVQSRSADPTITELGVVQAQRLAAHLCGAPPAGAPPSGKGVLGITHLYCSPMWRTLQTTLPLAQALELQPTVWPDIHEHGGMFSGNPRTGEGLIIHRGLQRSLIERDYPGFILPDSVTEEGWYQGGYEDMPGCYARAIRVARELRRRAHREAEVGELSTVAIVSHGTFIDALIKALFSQVPDRQFYYFHNNTAVTQVDFNPGGNLTLRFLNRTDHLPAVMLSE
jgi:broad specificity phosphatase PhoE